MFASKILICQTDSLYTDKKEDSFIFKYIENPSDKSKISNYFIEELSKNTPKSLSNTQYSFSFNYQALITTNGKLLKENKKEYTIFVDIKDGKCSGDVFYKNFSIAGELIPYYADFTISIENANGTVLKTIPINMLIVNTGSGKTDNIIIHDSLPGTQFKISLHNKLFYHTDSSETIFRKKIQIINDYYNSEPVISSALEKLKTINLENVEMIKVYSIKLKDIELLIEEFTNKAFPEKLKLSTGDPVHFINKFKELSQQAKRFRLLINQMISSLDHEYYKKGIENNTNGDTASALKFFRKSYDLNPLYTPALYQLAKIYYKQKELDSASKYITVITTKLNPEQQIIKQVISLGNDIYNLYLAISENFIHSENFHKALEFLEKARLFCISTPAVSCNEYLQKDIAKAKYGIYKSFITVSQKAVDKGILDIAEIYIIKAKDFQQENSSDIISSLESDDLLDQLVKGYTYKGILLNAQQQFDTAFIVLERAYNLCKKYAEIKCSDKLVPAITVAKNGIYVSILQNASLYIQSNEPDKAEDAVAKAKAYQQDNQTEIPNPLSTDSLTAQIKKQRYDKYISDGISYIKYGNGKKALSNLETAKLLEKIYPFKTNQQLDSLIKNASALYILNYLEKGRVKIWGNELHKARDILDSAKIISKKYSLSEDTTISKAMFDLKIRIANQQCKNAREAFSEYYSKAYMDIAIKKYSSADDLFSKCLKTAEENGDCKIQDSMARTSKRKYILAAIYQKKFEESEDLANNSKYYDAIGKYIECEKYFFENNIQQYGLEHIPLNDYLASQNDNTYIYICANYYIDKNNFDNAFLFMEVLRKRNYPESLTADLQEMLAQKLAQSNYTADKKQKPPVLINKHTGKNTWYIYFKKAYLSAWKDMKKKE